jgi:aminoglycoside phosphotransferase (APT) family kinase protein
MPVTNIYQIVYKLICWPLRTIITKLIIPYHARRIVNRHNNGWDCKAINYGSFLGIPFVIKVKEVTGIEREAKTLKFIADRTSIPVPKVYDIWRHPRTSNVGCLVMERIPGKSLRLQWRHLTLEQKEYVFVQIRPYLQELRKLPQPPPVGRIESLIGACFDIRINDDPFGPFQNEEEFHDWRLSTHDWLAHAIPDRLRACRQGLRDDHRIVFTHGDLHIQNVQLDLRGSRPEDAHVSALLDWEMSAWMPEYWEPIKMLHAQSDKDWRRLVLESFPGYEDEIAADEDLMYVSGRY